MAYKLLLPMPWLSSLFLAGRRWIWIWISLPRLLAAFFWSGGEDSDNHAGWSEAHHAAEIGNVTFLRSNQQRLEVEKAACSEVLRTFFGKTRKGENLAHIAVAHRQLQFLLQTRVLSDWAFDRPCGDAVHHRTRRYLSEADHEGRTPVSIVMDRLAKTVDENDKGLDTDFAIVAYIYEHSEDGNEAITKLQSWPNQFVTWLQNYTLKPWVRIQERLASTAFATLASDLHSERRLSLHPPAFELGEILTEGECLALIEDAENLLSQSSVLGQLPVERTQLQEFLKLFDADHDDVLNIVETRKAMLRLLTRETGAFADKGGGQQINAAQVAKLLQIDTDEDGIIDLKKEAFDVSKRDMRQFEAAMAKIKRALKSRQVRTNKVAWFPHYLPAANGVVRKMQAALGMEDWMVESAEQLQVVKYEGGEHYGPHLDGQARRATIYTYLNTVPRGGSTAFPFAHLPITRNKIQNVTFTRECHEHFNCCSSSCMATNATACDQELSDRATTDNVMTVKQMRHCLQTRGRDTWTLGKAGMEVPAKRGAAVIWFNYDPHVHGFRDELEESHHCGCDVEKGVKWGTNLWLRDAPIIKWAISFVDRTAHARHDGRQRLLPSLRSLAHESFDRWTTGSESRCFWLYKFREKLQRELLGIGPKEGLAHLGLQSPVLSQVETMEDHLRAAVLWQNSLNISSEPVEDILFDEIVTTLK